MDHNWPYVAAGYGVTTVAVVWYAAWIHLRLRRARRTLPESEQQ